MNPLSIRLGHSTDLIPLRNLIIYHLTEARWVFELTLTFWTCPGLSDILHFFYTREFSYVGSKHSSIFLRIKETFLHTVATLSVVKTQLSFRHKIFALLPDDWALCQVEVLTFFWTLQTVSIARFRNTPSKQKNG